MFVLNMRLKPSRRAVVIGAMLAGMLAVICVACMVCSQSKPSDSATCDELGSYSLSAETTGQQEEFLAQFGIDVVADSVEAKEVVIPEIFNDTYEKYNGLQRAVGLDLSAYRGEKAQKITFREPDSDERVTILVIDGRVVGGHRQIASKAVPLTYGN